MSDDKPTRRTEEPAPGTDPATVGEPISVVESREVPVAVTSSAPAQDAEPEGPAHRADAPVDARPAGDAAPVTPAAEDPRAELESDRPADAEQDAPPVRRGGAVPAGQSETADRTERLEQPAPPVAAFGSGPHRDGELSPAEQPTTEAPRLSQARAAAVPDQTSAAEPSVAAVPPVPPAPERADERSAGESRTEPRDDRPADDAPRDSAEQERTAVAAVPAPGDDKRTEDTADSGDTAGIRDARPEEAQPRGAVAPPAEAPVPIPAPTAPVQTTGEAPVAAPPPSRPAFLDSPVPPRKKGNRGFGILMSVLAAIVYALVWAGVAALIIAVNSTADRFGGSFTSFLVSPAYWGPVIVFLIGMIVLSLIVNRGGWAWWLIGGFLVAVAVYFGYLGSALATVAPRITPNEVQGFLGTIALSPLAIASGVIAREVSIWFGLATSARGRKVKARNAEARAEFDRESAERRAEYDRARSGIAE
ncbi:hypothetical protein [Naasia sp. SYSU D00057]|uniref:hypothetical protein n=1 Tax=Naasia sp. SYSU D00057 TaxID=2817380 RepID=UPI001B311D0A|nr:hypothetical protein [Naasia sp. SYSU D00057]